MGNTNHVWRTVVRETEVMELSFKPQNFDVRAQGETTTAFKRKRITPWPTYYVRNVFSYPLDMFVNDTKMIQMIRFILVAKYIEQ